MTRKEQNKILDDKIESNNNQYKVDRLNAEISAFSSGDLNKYEFFTRKDLNYKPNALDKARFEYYEEINKLKKINNTNNQRIQELEEKLEENEKYFDNYEENRIETEKKIKELNKLNDELNKEKEEIIKELDNKKIN